MKTVGLRLRSCLWPLSGFLFLSTLAFGQPARSVEDDSYLNANREHVAWPTPQSVLDDLRSADDITRLAALMLMGLSDQQAHRTVWASTNDGSAKVIGQVVISPERVQLMYAAIGEDASQQAILAFELPSLQATHAAVAVQKGKRWERIAALSCWCKYDMNSDQDMLAEFLSLRPAAEAWSEQMQHYDLVVHTNGGGTGIYAQDEAHFRVFHNELRNSLQFVSRLRSNNPTGLTPTSVLLERRWFTTTAIANGVWGGILVEAKGTVVADKLPRIAWDVRALQDMHLQKVACQAYRWDEKTFHYQRSNDVIPSCQVLAK
jgi:hypothetical protein